MLTVEELLAGKKVDMPLSQDLRTFKKAPRAKGEKPQAAPLPFDQTERRLGIGSS